MSATQTFLPFNEKKSSKDVEVFQDSKDHNDHISRHNRYPSPHQFTKTRFHDANMELGDYE